MVDSGMRKKVPVYRLARMGRIPRHRVDWLSTFNFPERQRSIQTALFSLGKALTDSETGFSISLGQV